MFRFFNKKNNSELYLKQLQVIEKISSVLLTEGNLDLTFDEICKSIPKVMNVSIVAILTWDKDHNQLKLAKISMPGVVEKFVENVTGKRINEIIYPTEDEKSPFTKAIRTQEIQYELDVTSLLYPLMEKKKAQVLMGLVQNQFKGAVVSPLNVKGELLGILSVGWKNEILTEEDKGVIKTFANQASIGIYNTRLFAENQKQLKAVASKNKRLQAINTLTNKIISNLNPEKLIQEALNVIPQLFGYLGVIYTSFDKEDNLIKIQSFSNNEISDRGFEILGLKPHDIKLDINNPNAKDNLVRLAIVNYQTVFSEKFHDIGLGIVPSFISDQVQKTLGITSLVTIPVMLKGDTVGAMTFLFNNINIDQVKKDELETLLIITNQITVALENASLYAQVDSALNQLKISNQQLQEKYQFEKDMMGIMGHELRTPMTVAKGMAELLMSKADKDVAYEKEYFKDKLEKIHMSVIKESELIQTMLSTSHIDNNKINLQLTKFSFSDLVDYAIMAFKKDARAKNLEINYIKSEKTLPEMYSDQSRVQEVVTNLISNAIKYTNKGKVIVEVKHIGENIVFRVKDTGIGIPKDQIQHLGQKFYRVHQYLDEEKDIVRAGGTGLGLYVVKGILEALGGELKIESEEGKGSTFTAVLPVNAHPDKEEAFITDKPVDKTDMFEELGLKVNY